MTRLWTLVALVACCAAASAQDAKPALPAPVLESLIKEPDYAKAWDLVFLAEGYPASEQELFFEQARLMARKLRFTKVSVKQKGWQVAHGSGSARSVGLLAYKQQVKLVNPRKKKSRLVELDLSKGKPVVVDIDKLATK